MTYENKLKTAYEHVITHKLFSQVLAKQESHNNYASISEQIHQSKHSQNIQNFLERHPKNKITFHYNNCYYLLLHCTQ